MLNINKIENGFVINGINYLFNNFENDNNGTLQNVSYFINSESQVLVGTTYGIIMLDLSCTIEGQEYTDINLFVQNLY